MLIQCNFKTCQKSSDAQLNVKTQEVFCMECHNVITNVTRAMKGALKSCGQIVRLNEKKAFMVNCGKCNANREVVLNAENDTVCKVCGHNLKLHAAFRQAMEEAGVKLAKLTAESKK